MDLNRQKENPRIFRGSPPDLPRQRSPAARGDSLGTIVHFEAFQPRGVPEPGGTPGGLYRPGIKNRKKLLKNH
jgi:hypothetical protein